MQINATGEVSEFIVTNAGSGYSFPVITIDAVGEDATVNVSEGTTAALTTLDAIAGGVIPSQTYAGAGRLIIRDLLTVLLLMLQLLQMVLEVLHHQELQLFSMVK